MTALAGVACSSALETSEAKAPGWQTSVPALAVAATATPEVEQAATGELDGESLPKAVADGTSLPPIIRELNPSGPKNVDTREFRQLLPRDGIRPVYDPILRMPDEVKLASDEMVIGVSAGGESRAYPIGPLRFREMVNDELGGIPILVTW